MPLLQALSDSTMLDEGHMQYFNSVIHVLQPTPISAIFMGSLACPRHMHHATLFRGPEPLGPNMQMARIAGARRVVLFPALLAVRHLMCVAALCYHAPSARSVSERICPALGYTMIGKSLLAVRDCKEARVLPWHQSLPQGQFSQHLTASQHCTLDFL